MTNLDHREGLLYVLREMQQKGSQAHHIASEEGGMTGTVRDLLFGVNTTIDAVVSLIESTP
jgi:hypothetical protein